MLINISTLSPWYGERINDILYPDNIEQLWTPEELASIGLAAPTPFVTPDGFHTVGVARFELDGSTVRTIFDTEADFVEPVVVVSAAQALCALDDAGLYQTVADAAHNHPVRAVGIWFDRATEWEIENPYVLAMQAECGISDEQKAALFLAASKK